jgi:hypothetical protein
MARGFTTVELMLIRDCLLKVTPSRNQADELWEVIEKLNKTIEGAHIEHAKKVRETKSATRDKK